MSKSFKSLMEELNGSFIIEKKFKVGKHSVEIKNSGKKFAVYVNNELLDSNFKSEKEAENASKEFIKLMAEELNK